MSIAILIGDPPADSALEDHLRALGFTPRRLEAGAAGHAARAARALEGALTEVPADVPVAVVDADFVGHRHALRLALTDPRFPAAAVPGALLVRPTGRAALAAAPGEIAGARPGDSRLLAPDTPLPDLLAARLEEAGTTVHRPALGTLVAAVPRTTGERAAAREREADVDDERVRLDSAVKSRDGFFTTFAISPWSRYLARWCARRGLTPNQVTTASLAVALIAAGCAATGTRGGFVAAGALLLFSFALDCADGQLARYTLAYSTLGAWLDATFDRVKEYAFYAGLAIGAVRAGDDGTIWALALGAMVLQTCRHIVDFAFTESTAPPTPASGTGAGTGGEPAGPAGRAAALSGRLDRVGWTIWLRRMIILPIGERWALIAVLTALTTPRTTLVVLLIAGGFAACYTTAGRLLRSLRPRTAGPAAARALGILTDTGPLAGAVARLTAGRRRPGGFAAPLWALAAVLLAPAALLLPGVAGAVWTPLLALGYAVCAGLAVAAPATGRLDWLLPPLFRLGEYGTVLVLAVHASGADDGWVNATLPAAFCLVAVTAYHHYDTVYRLRGGAGAPPRRLVLAMGGHEGRVLLVVAASALWAAGGTGLTVTLVIAAGALAVVVPAESVRFWTSSSAPAVHDEVDAPADPTADPTGSRADTPTDDPANRRENGPGGTRENGVPA
ncbi:DUF5941 domain-containing protein [Streptomyces alkaliphilus]|uniref:DUF5941 domain-containing protein n=1 Tax=Streptomyces alkaliphilus TaxID=1472722 RepID=UPI00117FDFCA|nr:DUF5941 domain-containing protein [Streptomyces alkaliphilus]MQS07199.1 CDP-alcohol phosphatidyltransferase family protein [Streptomyces alkaliphilus]